MKKILSIFMVTVTAFGMIVGVTSANNVDQSAVAGSLTVEVPNNIAFTIAPDGDFTNKVGGLDIVIDPKIGEYSQSQTFYMRNLTDNGSATLFIEPSVGVKDLYTDERFNAIQLEITANYPDSRGSTNVYNGNFLGRSQLLGSDSSISLINTDIVEVVVTVTVDPKKVTSNYEMVPFNISFVEYTTF